MNPFYEKFNNQDIDESIFKISQKKMTFEDSFWHLACMALYYKNNNNDFLEKRCLSKACDLNYIYNAYLYFDKCEFLPKTYQQYIKPFEHSMKNDQLELMIKEQNKKSRKFDGLGFGLYSLFTLLMLPLTLLFVFVFKMETTLSAFLSLGIVCVGQFVFTNYRRRKKQRNEMMQENNIPRELKQIFQQLQKYEQIFQEQNYVYLLHSSKEEEKNIIQCIKEHKIYQPPKKEKKKKDKEN